jgi:hypothetical protein
MIGGENWAPGDLALCVQNGVDLCPCGCGALNIGGACPPVGSMYRVTSVRCTTASDIIAGDPECEETVLELEHGFFGGAYRFRKIHPLTDEERCQELADLPLREEVRA